MTFQRPRSKGHSLRIQRAPTSCGRSATPDSALEATDIEETGFSTPQQQDKTDLSVGQQSASGPCAEILAALQGAITQIDMNVTALARQQRGMGHSPKRRAAPSFRKQPVRSYDPQRIEKLVSQQSGNANE